jgi:dolichol kinase
LLSYTDLSLITIATIAVTASIAYDPRTFLSKYIYSIPLILIIFFFTSSILVFPVYVLSLISAVYLYSKYFYIPFSVNILVVVFGGLIYNTSIAWIAVDIAVSVATIMTMLTDGRMKNFTFNNDSSRGKTRTIEISRDYLQTASGIMVMALIFIAGLRNSREIITVAILVLYAVGNYYSINRGGFLGNFLGSFERDNTPLGIGAIWFAAGVLFAYAIIHNMEILLVVTFILMVGDSVATIVGTRVRSFPLFYNRRKSFAGLMGMFVVSAIFGYFIIGPIAILYAGVGAFVESIAKYPFDDNYLIPLILAGMSVFV